MRTTLLIAATLLTAAVTAWAGPPDRDLDYEVFAGDKRLGTVELELRVRVDGTDTVRVSTAETRLKAKALFVTVFSLESRSVALSDVQGILVYESTGRIDGEDFAVRLTREDSLFVLQVQDDETEEMLRIPRSACDFTSELPKPGADAVQGVARTYRVLDLDRFEITPWTYTWIGDEDLDVDGRAVSCRVYDIASDHLNCRCWMATDDPGLTVREEGVDEDGPYRIRLRAMREVSP